MFLSPDQKKNKTKMMLTQVQKAENLQKRGCYVLRVVLSAHEQEVLPWKHG